MQRRTFLITTAAAGAASLLPRRGGAAVPSAPVDPPSDQWMQDAVDEARALGATHAEALYLSSRHQSAQVRKDAVHTISDNEEAGITLRVRLGNAPGSASVPAAQRGSPKDFARMAVDAANNAGPGLRDGATVIDSELYPDFHVDQDKRSGEDNGERNGKWSPAGVQDPFLTGLSERIAFLKEINATALKFTQIPYAVANQFLQKRSSLFVDSNGRRIEQLQYATYVNFAVTAFSQQRKRMDTRSSEREAQATDWAGATANMKSELETAMQEVLRLQFSDPVTPDSYDLVMHPTMLWNILLETLLPHFDARQLAGRDGRAPGDRLLTLENRMKPPLRAPALRLRWDSTFTGGLATAGWDDCGRPARAWNVMDSGGAIRNIPVSPDMLLSDPVYGLAFPGFPFSRAANWHAASNAGLPNIVLEGGEGMNIDDLIAGVDNGLFVKGRGTVVTNPAKTLFRVRPQTAWVIRGGKIAEMVRDVEIETSTEQFWNALAEVGRKEDAFLGGELFPARAFPLWDSPFSVVTPPALFRRIPVYRTEGRS